MLLLFTAFHPLVCHLPGDHHHLLGVEGLAYEVPVEALVLVAAYVVAVVAAC